MRSWALITCLQPCLALTQGSGRKGQRSKWFLPHDLNWTPKTKPQLAAEVLGRATATVIRAGGRRVRAGLARSIAGIAKHCWQHLQVLRELPLRKALLAAIGGIRAAQRAKAAVLSMGHRIFSVRPFRAALVLAAQGPFGASFQMGLQLLGLQFQEAATVCEAAAHGAEVARRGVAPGTEEGQLPVA